MDSITLSPTSSRSMKLMTPATAKVAFVLVYENQQSPNPVIHVIHLTGESFLLIDQVRDGLADILGADYVKKLHISNVNCDGDKSCENVFIANIVSFPTNQGNCWPKPIAETFAGSSSQLCPGFSLSRESHVPTMDVSSQQQSLDDASSIKAHYELKEIPFAGLPPSAPCDEGQSQQENDSTLGGRCSVPYFGSVQNAIEGESLLNSDDSTATSSLDEGMEICTIPVQASDHHVLQSSMPLQPQTLESNYNPSVDVCREGDGYSVEVLFHGYPMVAELDTGSPHTIISNESLTSILESTPEDWSARLEQRKEPSTIKELKAYNGGAINIREQIDVILTRDKRKVNTKVLIVEGVPVPLLIGKDVLPQLGYRLVERVSDSADECQHYQVIRAVPACKATQNHKMPKVVH